MKRRLLTILLGYCLIGQVYSQQFYPLKGKIIDSTSGEGLPGALIKLKDSDRATISNNLGDFIFQLQAGENELQISFIGYETKVLKVEVPNEREQIVKLVPEGINLSSVEIVSTGYQKLPKERATGSFVQVDNELVSRRITSNIIDRLEDVTPGLRFNRSGPDLINIRGRGTLFANTRPLVVIDNFPYDGPLENINPNDVESITVLRDAAAASIWGARAGNGVIVINTKKGGYNSPVNVSITSNFSMTDRPDAFYQPLMGTEEYIAIERELFSRGFYASTENSIVRAPLSPVIETLIDARDGRISQEQANSIINGFSEKDIRNDINAYLYRPRTLVQKSIGITAGSNNSKYGISLGYDKSSSESVGNEGERFTLSFSNDNKFLDGKLNMSSGIYIVKSQNQNNAINPLLLSMAPTGNQRLYPYASLKDDDGNPLPITHEYRRNFVLDSEQLGLLDWQYRPLQEIQARDYRTDALDFRLNLGLDYNIHRNLKITASYQFWQNENTRNQLNSVDTYFTRNLINRFSRINPNGSISRPIPIGDILDIANNSSHSHQIRGLISYNNTWREKHDISFIGGAELKDFQVSSNSNRFYGLDSEIGRTSPVDYISFFNPFHFPLSVTRIPFVQGFGGSVERFTSVFANAGYTYSNRYLISGSARKDASNIFGVDTNRKGVPLWSAGLGWIISNESFYNSSVLPFLKLRFTQGSNGNVDRTLSAFTTAQIFGNSFLTGRPFARVQNPPNPNLRWEKISISNFALDFEAKNGRLYGSVEYFIKNGTDLIGEEPFPPSTGITLFRGNIAESRATGMDLVLNSENIQGRFNWNTSLFLSTINEKVTSYDLKATPSQYLIYSQTGTLTLPLEGKPLFAVYALPWAGLNPENGNPRGFLDGEPSENYNAILSALSPEEMVFMGPSRPTVFGSLRNDFSYKNFHLSFNIAYRMGYYFRRESIIYGTNRGLGGHLDYNNRWQQPGDELVTQIPSVPEIGNANRDNIYRFSEHLVERGDHIRLRDIRISYRFKSPERGSKIPFQNAEVFFYADNLGMIWKSTNDPLDPDFRTMRQLKNFSVGFNISM